MAFTTDMFAGVPPAASVTSVFPPGVSGWAGITKEPNAGAPSAFQSGPTAIYAITTDKWAACVTTVCLAFSH
jgi:hypothetical protein